MIPSLQSNNFLQLISTYLPDMLWAKDMDGNYIFANKAMRENILMIDENDVVAGKSDIFFSQREKAKRPEDPNWHTFGELCRNSDKIVLQEMKPMRFEEYGNIKGELFYFDVNKAPFFDDAGNLIGVIGSARDITEHKRVERELEISNRLIDSGPVVVFEWSGDKGWPIIFVSSNIESVLGISYKKMQAHTRKFSDFVHPDDLSMVTKEVQEHIASQTASFVQEYRLLREDSSVVWIKDFTIIDYSKDGTLNTIKGYVFDNTTEKIAANRAVYLSHHNQLTGLPNRQKMMLDIENNPPLACAIFNIDSFRELNDFFGTTVGDNILMQLAKELKRMEVVAYRIGGDEFAVLFYESFSKNAIQERITHMLLRLHEMKLSVADETISINMNVGVAFGSERILTRADIALHTAKEKKLSIAIYEEDEHIEELYKKNIAMTATIHKALLEDRIICYYQPIVNFKTQKVMKYETLVRMIDEHGNIIPPNDFLTIAKKTKLYPRITHKVIYQACHSFASRDEEFSINLSIEDLNNPYVVQYIIKTIIETGTANRIIFELLETEEIENYDLINRFVTQVKALGARIAIDDFGAGYSNFEHILRLNIDYIKIDGSLIKGIATNDRHRIIVETIVDFAKKINVHTVAEYFCDEMVYEVVKELGVDFSQGYYTGKPGPLL